MTKLVIGIALMLAISGAQAQTAKLDLDPTGAVKAKVGYFPAPIKLTDTKPACIVKEPKYRATPKYGVVHIGNGPASTYVFAVDEPANDYFKIYFDVNRNGDLTDDGDGFWSDTSARGARMMYGVNHYVLRASWGTPKRETSSGEYGLALYRFTGNDVVYSYREAARTGSIKIDAKTYKVVLMENDADGCYSKPLDDNGKPVGGGDVTRPVWLWVDLNNDGKASNNELIDIRSPFKLLDKAYVATVSPDGAKMALAATTRKVPDKPIAKEPEPPLKPGTVAPDFTAEALGGGTVKLSDLKGKVVILDFWATWCGPCQASMPHLEKVYQQVKDQDVVVLGVCVWDEKASYEKWVPANSSKYHFRLAFDPAGRDKSNIAQKLFSVSGIPTTFVIDKEGKIVAAIVGYDENGHPIEDALKKVNIKVE